VLRSVICRLYKESQLVSVCQLPHSGFHFSSKSPRQSIEVGIGYRRAVTLFSTPMLSRNYVNTSSIRWKGALDRLYPTCNTKNKYHCIILSLSDGQQRLFGLLLRRRDETYLDQSKSYRVMVEKNNSHRVSKFDPHDGGNTNSHGIASVAR
jgi:hypothetical protein